MIVIIVILRETLSRDLIEALESIISNRPIVVLTLPNHSTVANWIFLVIFVEEVHADIVFAIHELLEVEANNFLNPVEVPVGRVSLDTGHQIPVVTIAVILRGNQVAEDVTASALVVGGVSEVVTRGVD